MNGQPEGKSTGVRSLYHFFIVLLMDCPVIAGAKCSSSIGKCVVIFLRISSVNSVGNAFFIQWGNNGKSYEQLLCSVELCCLTRGNGDGWFIFSCGKVPSFLLCNEALNIFLSSDSTRLTRFNFDVHQSNMHEWPRGHRTDLGDKLSQGLWKCLSPISTKAYFSTDWNPFPSKTPPAPSPSAIVVIKIDYRCVFSPHNGHTWAREQGANRARNNRLEQWTTTTGQSN